MQQRRSSVAAFVYYCLLVHRDSELLQGVLSDAEDFELAEWIEVCYKGASGGKLSSI
jgi:hypothetical protein